MKTKDTDAELQTSAMSSQPGAEAAAKVTAETSAATPAAAPHQDPQEGGSWLRDPVTGALTPNKPQE